jgi:cholest-4-en-3-one 26-monooxygenase
MSAAAALDDIDLLDLDRWSREGAPHGWFARLRDEAPVWRHPSPGGGPGFWVVSGYDDVVGLGRCPEALSSDGTKGGVSGLGPGDELADTQARIAAQLGTDVLAGGSAILLTLDPPEHTAYRKLVNKGFTPRMVALLEERTRRLVAGYLDAIDTDAPVDLVTALAMPLPMQVIAEMIGAPRAMHADLARWSNESVAGTDPEYRNDQGDLSALAAGLQLLQAFEAIKVEHEVVPADDLTTVLLEAEVDGESLTPVRFKMFLVLLTLAGNETTRNAISHAVLELAARPDEWQRLRDDPALIPSAVEEVLRYASPVLYFRRNATAGMVIGDQAVAAGDIVSLWYVSANRDASRFVEPDRFDVGRTPNDHVAFGGGGPHFCLGASLARLELRVVLEALVERYEALELVGPVERLRSNFLHGIKHLPVRLR